MVGLLVFNHLSGFCLTFGLFLFLQISILALVEQNIQAWAKFEVANWTFLACWNSKLATRYHYYSHWHAANWLGPIWDDLYRTWFLKTSQLMRPRFIFIEGLNDLTRITAAWNNLKSNRLGRGWLSGTRDILKLNLYFGLGYIICIFGSSRVTAN